MIERALSDVCFSVEGIIQNDPGHQFQIGKLRAAVHAVIKFLQLRCGKLAAVALRFSFRRKPTPVQFALHQHTRGNRVVEQAGVPVQSCEHRLFNEVM